MVMPEARPDLDSRATTHYSRYGSDVPRLDVGDEIILPEGPSDVLIVLGIRAGGMLIDAVRKTDGQEFCLPRFYVPLRGEGAFLRRRDESADA